MDLSATLANYPGFAAAGPGDVRVTVKRGAKTWYTNAAFGVGGALTKIWLPTGGGAYTVTAEPASPSAFWPAVSVDKSVPAAQPTPAEAVAAALTLEEKAATLQVTVTGAPPSGATLTLTPPSGVTVPPGYLPSVPTGADGKVDLKLPGGSWKVTATIPGDDKYGTKALLAPVDYPLTIAVVWPKATGATAGIPGSFTPSNVRHTGQPGGARRGRRESRHGLDHRAVRRPREQQQGVLDGIGVGHRRGPAAGHRRQRRQAGDVHPGGCGDTGEPGVPQRDHRPAPRPRGRTASGSSSLTTTASWNGTAWVAGKAP